MEIKKCRDCRSWVWTSTWKGNCIKLRWDKDKFSEDAEPQGCPDYKNKYNNKEDK